MEIVFTYYLITAVGCSLEKKVSLKVALGN